MNTSARFGAITGRGKMAKKKPMPFGKKGGAMPPMMAKKPGKKGKKGGSDMAKLKQMRMPM